MKKASFSLFIIFIFSLKSFAGWMFIEKKTNSQGLTTNDTIVVQNNKMRSGGKEATYIYDLDLQKVTVMNNFYKTYWTGSPEAYREGVIAGLKEQMEVIVNRLPKEKQAAARSRLEGIMSAMSAPKESAPKKEVVDVKKIIDKIMVLGYNTQRYELWMEGKKKISIWISEKILINSDFNLDKFNQLMQRLMSNNPKLAIKSSSEYIAILRKGYPLKSTEYLGNGEVKSEVVYANKQNYAPVLFSPGPSFKAVPLDVLIKSMKIKG
ncbi:MAG: DUF4412 domain-containing protein [Bacteroidota bacterium]